MCNSLNLYRQRCEVIIEGIGATTNAATRGRTTVTIRSTIKDDFELQFETYILRSITSTTPTTSIDASSWKHLRKLQLADPAFAKPGRIDLLIGADLWGDILQDGIVTGHRHEPCAIRTHLGWVVFGRAITNTVSDKPLRTVTANKCVGDERLDELLHKFWELEEPTTDCEPTPDLCETIFQSTVRRNKNGRYSVQIPFRPDALALGNSHQLALRQFHQLERRLSNDSELRSKYIEFMREYITLNHMETVPDHRGDPTQSYYIPHHAVTGKFRVVFNASAKTSNGVSLNDTQLVGQQLQDPLVNIIFRFRRGRIAITGDIEKMFRQVEVDPRHRQWQQILWRESSSEPLRTYQLKTVTYGMACGPFNAIRALRQCAIDNHHIITDVSRAAAARNSILSNFYVDDFLDSADCPSAAVTLALDIDSIIQQGKFHLRKWNSNDTETLIAISGSSSSATELNLNDSDTTVLGLHWNPITDQLFYKIKVCEATTTPTKRLVLSDIARLYDPTGMLAPVIVTAKIFIQNLWREKLEWDTPLPTELRSYWETFRNALHQLTNIRVTRWLGMKPTATINLHGFCDASNKAYAAVVYAQIIDADGQTHISLVTAKTKVAPVKAITIPRLELCAAHLLIRTINNVRTSLQLSAAEYTLWSDSTIVLCWLRKPAANLKQYVSNRVAYIQTHSNINRWRHIRTEHNPADCASRGLSPAALEGYSLWWKGPSCLYEGTASDGETPSLTLTEEQTVANETKPFRALLGRTIKWKLTTCVNGGDPIPLIERFESLYKLLHTTALVLRFRPAGRKYWRTKFIAAAEVEEALLLHIRQTQANVYSTEINLLKSRCSVDSPSKLLALNPFLDNKGILRVGGRLAHADLGYDQRHPIILPKDSTLATLLVGNAHSVTLHGGIQEMLQYLRRRFWIIHGRALVKTYIHRCVVCKRNQRTMQQQQMASLPRSRVLVAPPFTNTGLDYCGPFNIRLGGRRSATTTKTYAVIFICMATKAIHIELAEDLSTRAFLDVFDRFVSRRGYSTTLYSDNGTQFVGADRLMRQELKEWHNNHAQQHVSDAGVKWNFITPAAPHQGGLWEAAVRSAKRHLIRIIGNQPIYYHQLNTLLIRIEACLNSRPIIALHDDPEGGTALTPGEFLIGRPITTRPEPTVSDVPENRLKYWQRLQRMYQHFWQRWQQEYLALLQARGKWARAEPNLQLDDVVVIQHDNLPPSRWRLGRIIDVHPGSDGLVRVATIEYNSDQKTPDGQIIKHQCQRPIQKLCRLTSADETISNRIGLTGQECMRSESTTIRS